MVQIAQRNGLVRGLAPEYIPNGIAILQYADDTILCLDDDEDTAQNMKLLLYIYEKMSGLKINFEKSEVLMISTDSGKNYQILRYVQLCSGAVAYKILRGPSCWIQIAYKRLDEIGGESP
jgi:hypothetical protein